MKGWKEKRQNGSANEGSLASIETDPLMKTSINIWHQ
jgi:hypothetical protein